MSSLPLVLVAAGLIRDASGRVLLSQRRPGDDLGLLWEFPGGKVEPFERPEEALIREMAEEVGLTVSALTPWRFVSHRYERFDLLMVVFACGRFSGTARPLDVHDVGWFELSALPSLAFPPADLPLVGALLAG